MRGTGFIWGVACPGSTDEYQPQRWNSSVRWPWKHAVMHASSRQGVYASLFATSLRPLWKLRPTLKIRLKVLDRLRGPLLLRSLWNGICSRNFFAAGMDGLEETSPVRDCLLGWRCEMDEFVIELFAINNLISLVVEWELIFELSRLELKFGLLGFLNLNILVYQFNFLCCRKW